MAGTVDNRMKLLRDLEVVGAKRLLINTKETYCDKKISKYKYNR